MMGVSNLCEKATTLVLAGVSYEEMRNVSARLYSNDYTNSIEHK